MPTAAMFLLKARHSYRDQGPTDGSGDGARVAVQINIPAPLSSEAYSKLVKISPPALTSERQEA